MIKISSKGDFSKTFKFLNKMSKWDPSKILDKYAKMGVDALAAATPVDSGETANSWSYEIKTTKQGATIYWTNHNTNKGVNIAVILQYGHGTGTGGYVNGIDYINPSLKPIFDKIANDAWMEVVRS